MRSHKSLLIEISTSSNRDQNPNVQPQVTHHYLNFGYLGNPCRTNFAGHPTLPWELIWKLIYWCGMAAYDFEKNHANDVHFQKFACVMYLCIQKFVQEDFLAFGWLAFYMLQIGSSHQTKFIIVDRILAMLFKQPFSSTPIKKIKKKRKKPNHRNLIW